MCLKFNLPAENNPVLVASHPSPAGLSFESSENTETDDEPKMDHFSF